MDFIADVLHLAQPTRPTAATLVPVHIGAAFPARVFRGMDGRRPGMRARRPALYHCRG